MTIPRAASSRSEPGLPRVELASLASRGRTERVRFSGAAGANPATKRTLAVRMGERVIPARCESGAARFSCRGWCKPATVGAVADAQTLGGAGSTPAPRPFLFLGGVR